MGRFGGEAGMDPRAGSGLASSRHRVSSALATLQLVAFQVNCKAELSQLLGILQGASRGCGLSQWTWQCCGVGWHCWGSWDGQGHGLWLPCLLSAGKYGFLGLAWLSCLCQGSRPGWCTQGCILVCELLISFIHLDALSAVGNSFRQFLLLPLMLTMVGTCLLLALFSAQPQLWGRLCGQPTTTSGPLAFPAWSERMWS